MDPMGVLANEDGRLSAEQTDERPHRNGLLVIAAHYSATEVKEWRRSC